MIAGYWAEGSRAYHHTAPISMTYVLHEALALVLEEGLEQRADRHRAHSRALLAGLEVLGEQVCAAEKQFRRRRSLKLPVRSREAPRKRF